MNNLHLEISNEQFERAVLIISKLSKINNTPTKQINEQPEQINEQINEQPEEQPDEQRKEQIKEQINEQIKEQPEEQEYEINIELFKKMIIRWLKVDDKMKEYNKEIKELKNEQSQIGEKILLFMKINKKDEIPIKNEKLLRKKIIKKEPINEEYIKNSLLSTLKDISQVDKLITNLMNNRNTEEIYKLNRKTDKPKKEQVKIAKR